MTRSRYSEGSLVKVGRRGHKQWQGQWYVYVIVAGKELRRRRKKNLGAVGETSELTAREQLKRYILATRGADQAVSPDITVGELWERYCAYKSASWGSHAQWTIKSCFRNRVLPRIGAYPVLKTNLGHLQGLLNELSAAEYSVFTLRRVRVYLKAMFEYALDLDILSRNPARGKKLVVPQSAIESDERVLNIDDIRKLDAATRSSRREHLILSLFLVGGFRPQELFALRVDDVLGEGSLRVDEALKYFEKGAKRVGRPKTKTSLSTVFVGEAIQREIDAWVEQLEDQSLRAWLFPSETGTFIMPANYRKRVFQPLAMQAGVCVRREGEKEICDLTFRMLRRTCATFFRGNIKGAQRQLRHKNPQMTADHYSKSITSEHREAVGKVSDEMFLLSPMCSPELKASNA